MVDRVDFRENIKVNVLHVTKQELLEDFEFAPEIIQSGFYKHVYSSVSDSLAVNPSLPCWALMSSKIPRLT